MVKKERNKKVNFNTRELKYKLKKYYDKRWKKVFLILIGILILNSFIFLFSGKNLVEKGIKNVLYRVGVYTEEIRSVKVSSNDYENDIDGGISITKNSRWIDQNTAQVDIILESKIKEREGSKKDIVVLLNATSSIEGGKIQNIKESFANLADYIFRNEDNRMSLITFNDKATVNSEFTTSKDDFLNSFNGINFNDKRSFKVGLNALRTFLSDYQETDKELIVMFIIDGYANLDTSSYILEYKLLKEEHPMLKINGITYEYMNNNDSKIKEISDNQFISNNFDIEETLFEAAVNPLSYEYLEITDLINDEYFYLENENDISVTSGDIALTEENNSPKIIWNLNGLNTGQTETLTLKVKTKEEHINEVGYFPTNKKEEATYKVENDEEKKVTSSLTPVLKNGYVLTYDTNPPTGCNIKNITTETHNAFYLVTKKSDTLSCPGYQFKGWEPVEDLVKVNDDVFIMAEHDTIIRAVWTNMNISKSMSGTINIKYNLPFNDEEAFLDNENSTFVKNSNGINFNNISSTTNGRGLYVRAGTEKDKYPIMYYRGNINNNNVLFGGFCWKIVRTTELGGTKLVYNGISNNGVCDKTNVDATIGSGIYNSNNSSIGAGGYMYGDVSYNSIMYSAVDTPSIIYSSDVTWDGTKYTLNMDDSYTSIGDWNNADATEVFNKYRYTCGQASVTSCDQVYYFIYHSTNSFTNSYVLSLNNGKKIENVIPEVLPDSNERNKNDSAMKTTIDTWYKNNLINYSDYLEDATWCNNRTITSTGIWFTGEQTSRNNSLVYLNEDFNGRIKDKDVCPNIYDRFTVNNESGNKMLQYPIALLTVEEFVLSGTTGFSSKDSYLVSALQWTMTPSGYTNGEYVSRIPASGMLSSQLTDLASSNIRPSIVLKEGIRASRGIGTSNNPYVVE